MYQNQIWRQVGGKAKTPLPTATFPTIKWNPTNPHDQWLPHYGIHYGNYEVVKRLRDYFNERRIAWSLVLALHSSDNQRHRWRRQKLSVYPGGRQKSTDSGTSEHHRLKQAVPTRIQYDENSSYEQARNQGRGQPGNCSPQNLKNMFSC